MKRHQALIAATLLWASVPAFAEDKPTLREVKIRSTHDGTEQPARMYVPKADAAVPLCVMLHTWSGDYRQKGDSDKCLAECHRRGWAMIHPNFRGPNRRPEACASPAAKQDVLDAVEYMKKQTKIDPQRIYLVGTSGGGHMSMVMATVAPELWAGVSAWVPITDLAAWHRECTKSKRKYAGDLEKSCGGAPGDSDEVDRQYRLRSSLPHLHAAKGLPIDINAGIHDGHTGSVPISHTLRAFNALAEANGQPTKRLSDDDIQQMTQTRKVPEGLAGERVDEPGREADRRRPILFRREASPVRVTIFSGGHEGDIPTALRWLATCRRDSK